MDKDNGAIVLLAIRCFQNFTRENPQWLYWTFFKSRASVFKMPANTSIDIVLVRLACLMRATSKDCKMLPTVWASLSEYEKEHLAQHFLADGIIERTVLFSFLPTYLPNAKQNAQFGLLRAL